MNSGNWQEAVAILLVALASVYLVMRARAVLLRRKASACGGGCSQYPQAATPESSMSPTIVSVEQLTASARQLHPSRQNGQLRASRPVSPRPPE